MEGIGALISQAVKGDAAEERFDQLLEERFDPRYRRNYAREIDAHDRKRPPGRFDLDHVRRKLRVHGDVAENVRRALTDWVPRIQALAADRGLRLSDLNHEVHLYSKAAFARDVGPLPPGVRLPASSCRYNETYRIYQIRVVLPERIVTPNALLTVLRAVLTRLFGDVFLREEVFSREAYREDVVEPPEAYSVGVWEQLLLLADAPHSSPELEAALKAHAGRIRMDIRRLGAKVRQDYFRTLRAQLAEKPLSDEVEAMIGAVFRGYLADLRADLPAARQALISECESLNAQINFLPVDERPEYLALLEDNPLHYLRAAKLRLEFLLETLGSIIEDFDAMNSVGTPLSAMAEDRIGSYLEQLRAQHLVRPYLLPDVRLGEEAQRRKTAFPLELHALIQRLPRTDNPTRLFKSLSRRIENSIYQRAYGALLTLQHWVNLADRGRAGSFTGAARHRSLSGQVANFRLRRPILEALFTRMGVILDLGERAAQPGQGRARVPVEDFSRAWGHFVAHLLTAEFLASEPVLKGFDAERYWQGVESGLMARMRQGAAVFHGVWFLRLLQRQLGADALGTMVNLLQNPTGTFRFAVHHALAPWPPGDDEAFARRQRQLGTWAEAVLTSWRERVRNAIVLTDDAASTA